MEGLGVVRNCVRCLVIIIFMGLGVEERSGGGGVFKFVKWRGKL